MASELIRLTVLTVEGRDVRCHIAAPAPDAVFSPAINLPIILLHGLGCSSDAWRPTLNVLAERRLPCPVFVPDMPGFGCSPGPNEAMGMADLADWTVRLMDTLSVERAHLAGNSMGCQVALALARRHPARVGGLVLVGPTVGEQYIPFWRYALGLLLDGVREPLIYNAVLARMYAQQGIPRYLATTRKMLEDEPLRHATKCRRPASLCAANMTASSPMPSPVAWPPPCRAAPSGEWTARPTPCSSAAPASSSRLRWPFGLQAEEPGTLKTGQ